MELEALIKCLGAISGEEFETQLYLLGDQSVHLNNQSDHLNAQFKRNQGNAGENKPWLVLLKPYWYCLFPVPRKSAPLTHSLHY